MPITYQQALGFLQSQTAAIETQVYKVKYPDIQYPNLVYVDTSANEWASSVVFYSQDSAGKADWFHAQANDMPRADVKRGQGNTPVHMAGIGYGYDLEELGQSMMIPGMSLTADKAMAARRAYDEFLDRIVIVGDATKGIEGLADYTGITAATAPADGTGSSPAWADKTADQIIRDINDMITGQYTASLTVELADTILLPVASLALVSTKRVPDTSMTVMDYIRRNNVYTQVTGQELMIRAVRGLETAGDGGTGRMVAYRNDREVVKLHLPMPHRFLPVWQTGPTRFDVPGIFRTGGVEVRRPGAFRYVDGIIVPPSV
jgi:hypothetical protein